MQGKDIVKIAADLSIGAITHQAIEAKYGSAVLSLVVAAGVGYLANEAIEAFDNETGIVSDIGSLVDDVFSIF